MNKLLIIMLSVALVSVGCSPANKKSSNSKPEAVEQRSSFLDDVDDQPEDHPVFPLANKKASPPWALTPADRVLQQEYQELLREYSSPIYAVNNRIADFYEVQKKLDAIPKEDPSRKDERITLQKELRDILQDIHHKNTHKAYALGLIDMPRLLDLDRYFTSEGSSLPSVSTEFWKLPKKVEVEQESDN